MKILVLCDRYPYPLYNGQNLRIFHYVRHLSTRHSFDLLCYGDGSPPSEITSFFGSITAFSRPVFVGSKFGYSIPFRPSQMLPENPEFAEYLGRVLREGRYDLVWMSGWDTVISVPRPCPVPFLADIVDDGVLELWREFKSRKALLPRVRAAKRLLENVIMERFFFAPADACLVVSERDRDSFARVCPKTPVHVIHNGVDEEHFRPTGAPVDDTTLVFEGSMEFPPNVDAARYLVLELLPLVRQRVPTARVVLVGRDPAPEVQALACEYVEVTGFVDDVRSYLDSATVFVCPMRKGAGIKNKLLQAWAMAKPVVATSTATGGLAVRREQNIVIRDNTEDLAVAIADLLQDRPRQEAIGQAAHETVIENYTWARKALELEALMNVVSEGRRGE